MIDQRFSRAAAVFLVAAAGGPACGADAGRDTPGNGSAPPSREGFVATEDGARMYYRIVGDGPQVVAVPAALYLAEPLAELADGRRLVFFDPVGRGRSDPADTTTVSLDRSVRDVESLRRGLGIERMAMIGWSGLGMETAVYAIRHPGRVTRLLQVSPVPPTSGEYALEDGVLPRGERVDRAALAELERRREAGAFDDDPQALCRAANEITLPTNFVDTALARQVPDVCIYRNEWSVNLNPYFRALLGSFGEYDWRDSIRALGIPRLVIHGRQDPIPLAGGRAWAAADPNARLLLLSPSGHFPFLEQREAFLAAADEFLRGDWPEGAIRVEGQ